MLEYAGHNNYDLLPMHDGCYGTHNIKDGELRLIFSEPLGYAVDGEVSAFRLRFKVLSGGKKLSEVLHIDHSVMEAAAYDVNFAMYAVRLNFSQLSNTTAVDAATGTILYQNRPNPFREQTEVRFFLPETTKATLTVYDITGRIIFERSSLFAQGEHSVWVELPGSPPGLFYYRLTTPAGRWVRKMEKLNSD
jgi:hypothetical protein